MSRTKETGTILGSLIVGALAGAVAALLLAPQSGKETRDQLSNEIDKLKKELDKYANDFSEKAKKIKQDLEVKLRKTEAELRDMEDELGV